MADNDQTALWDHYDVLPLIPAGAIDELKHAGHEHLDADFVAGYDRKQGYNISPSERESACGGRRGLFQSRRARKRRIFEPQLFPKYHETYYAAYWHDPHGFMLKVVCHKAPE